MYEPVEGGCRCPLQVKFHRRDWNFFSWNQQEVGQPWPRSACECLPMAYHPVDFVITNNFLFIHLMCTTFTLCSADIISLRFKKARRQSHKYIRSLLIISPLGFPQKRGECLHAILTIIPYIETFKREKNFCGICSG